MHDVLSLVDLVADELAERREAGYELGELEARIEEALGGREPVGLERLLQSLETTRQHADWPYEEPSALDEIRATLPPPPSVDPFVGEAVLADRLAAAWQGRCAGCNLGKPVEGWDRAQILRYLEIADAFPLDDYFPKLDPVPEGFELRDSWAETTRGNVRFMARDDDTDYTILGLHLLETYGFEFSTEDVAAQWLEHMPFLQVYTAERAAYRNLILGLRPPETASHRNPYREWIGAQIRADMWGYVSPGNPQRASWLAYKDAALSHTQNGIYGEMWAAALIAACFTASDMRAALEVSLTQIPPRCRLSEALRDVMGWNESGLDWSGARDLIEERLGHYGFVHTINNAAVVAAALLWGDGDFTKTIGLAVQGGWDTDCNGATAGSSFGAMHGSAALPAHWTDPLNDRIRSAISGFDNSRISDLAERTLQVALGAADARVPPGRVGVQLSSQGGG
jgi:ADP-ribosylglycohydrolase